MTKEQVQVEQQVMVQAQAQSGQSQVDYVQQAQQYPLETINACALMSSPID